MTFPRACWMVVAVAALLAACGGGGGGGGSGGSGGGPGATGTVQFLGFEFLDSAGQTLNGPPLENLDSVPPTPGASLDLRVRFLFSGVPAGPFSHSNLPVATTAEDLGADLQAPAGFSSLPAKGTHVLVVDEGAGLYAVDFVPTIPTQAVQASFSAPAAAQPAYWPGSLYTVRVVDSGPFGIGNLKGGGGESAFSTTSNPAAYYGGTGAEADPPALTAVEPADGSTDFLPGLFAEVALGASQATFPAGPSDLLLTYDRALLPSAANLLGKDLDNDGVDEPVFVARTRAGRLLVGHTVPAGAFGPHGEVPAVSALVDGEAVDAGGDDVVVPSEPGAGPVAALPSTPSSLAPARDPGLVYALLPVDGGPDQLTVLDHLLGVPSHGAIAAAPLDTDLDEAVGLTTLLDGRLLTFDRASARLVELLPEVERQRPTPTAPVAGPPLLLSLASGDGETGFRSEPFPAPVPDVLDLLQAPSGRLYALVGQGGGAFPALQRLTEIDLDGNGAFDADDGLPHPAAALIPLPADYADVLFESEGVLLALDRTRDVIERVDLVSGATELVVADVGSFGFGLGGQPSPATCLAAGFLDLDLAVSLAANGDSGAVVRLEPQGILPFGVELTILQRNTLTSLFGTNEVNADLSDPAVPLGFVELSHVTTAVPVAGPDVPVDDVFLEPFDNALLENGQPTGLNPLADWAQSNEQGLPSGGLRASVGVTTGVTVLGDFRPQPPANFDPDFIYIGAPPSVTDQDLHKAKLGWQLVLLDTDSQTFPLADGSTPGVTQQVTIKGGHFVFRDFIIPAGVQVIARGSRPLRITATGRVEINGLLDLSGRDGVSDDTFNSGFLPVPGGPGGAGGGRGGDGQPTRFDPKGPGTIDQYVTPETGGRGMAPVPGSSGTMQYLPLGGHGGLASLAYDPNPNGFPKLDDSQNTERQRPAGGGGGSFYFRGDQAYEGSGAYSVQSESSWYPFTLCPTNNKKNDALYGNDENFAAGQVPNTPLQCVYLEGTLDKPIRIKPGGLGGNRVFVDDDPSNDFIGPGGELPTLLGGQGGGGGGSRIDSMRHRLWSQDNVGSALPSPPAPPYYPALVAGIFLSPAFLDAKGGGGGGAAGSVHIRCYGDVVIGKNGYIDCSGGSGGGGELVQNSSFSGGGGGGSGGAIIIEAAGSIRLEADAEHHHAGYTDAEGDRGASLDVTGGYGRDARTSPTAVTTFTGFDYDANRSDGGQGGFGMVQLQAGDGSGLPQIQEGAYVFARKRHIVKLGKWTGDNFDQEEHEAWLNGIGGPPPDDLRYIDMLHYRQFKVQGASGGSQRAYVLNGTYPPIMPSSDGNNGGGLVNEWPSSSGQLWNDTPMLANALSGGVPVVREPFPEMILESYLGWDPVTFKEPFWQQGPPPGTLYDADDEIPFSVALHTPDGTPFKVEQGGQEIFDPAQTVDRLPLVHPALVPFSMGTRSTGTSVWLDTAGVALRPRDGAGRTPPFFSAFHGTWNPALGVALPNGLEGTVRLGAPVPQEDIPAHFVLDGGFDDPGLFDPAPTTGANPPYNDLKVDAPDSDVAMTDVLTDNARLTVRFQGAYPVRPGSHVPDPQTVTAWQSDPTTLDGYPLVRFQVLFDLDQDLGEFPVGLDSLRPQLDYLRLRTRY